MTRDLVLGLDGGGTRTRARLANVRAELLGRGAAGASNPQANGDDAAERAMLQAIQAAFDDAHLVRRMVAAACFGVGGVERPAERTRFENWARTNVAPRVKFLNDGEILLAAGTPEQWGIALIAGTGMIGWGKSREGQVARAGGWGYLIGDEGSAFDLAREALRAVTQAADGRGAPTSLLRAVLDYWQLHDVLELVPKVYQSGLMPRDLASLAPLVIHAAEEGDDVAQRLIEHAGSALALTVLAVARRLHFEHMDIPLALSGGLLVETELVRVQVVRDLTQSEYKFAPIELVREPVLGAVRIAVEMARVE